MRELSIDIETYCEVDIKSAGLYKYAAEAEIILFAYSVDKRPPKCIDLLAGEIIPPEIIAMMLDKNVRKTAHNAPFEIEVISNAMNLDLDEYQWRCSAVLAAIAGYPMSLDEASKALGTAEKKDGEGKALIRYFCIPCKPTKANGGRTRNLPHHAPEKWAKFIEYCKQDVVTEQAITEELAWVELPEVEHRLWCLDQQINRRGWKVDIQMANCAIELDKIYRERLSREAVILTGLSNPNSPAQIKTWLQENIPDFDKLPTTVIKKVGPAPDHYGMADGEDEWDEDAKVLSGLTKDIVTQLLKLDLDPRVKRVLEIRQEMGKTSIKKYIAMIKAAGKGDRVRGLFQFCGAGRTWRWAGRLVQVQNLPRILLDLAELMAARELVKARDLENIEWVFGSLSNILSQLIRTAFISEYKKRLLVLDFSAIEAVMLAWLADEQWRLDIFKGSGKIYEASASQMFKVGIETIAKGKENYSMRAKGKVAELACGYGGGVHALEKMGALDMGLTTQELPFIIKKWREASPNIVRFWYSLQRSAIQCIETGEKIDTGYKGIYFSMKKGALLLYLPSGRCLMYPKASIKEVTKRVPIMKEFIGLSGEPIMKQTGWELKTRKTIFFWGINQTTKKWEEMTTYSGKLCENICQAVARDCLANAMMNIDAVGIDIVATVHDEIIAEMPLNVTSIKEMKKLMLKPAPWMAGLPLRAEGDESLYYNK